MFKSVPRPAQLGRGGRWRVVDEGEQERALGMSDDANGVSPTMTYH